MEDSTFQFHSACKWQMPAVDTHTAAVDLDSFCRLLSRPAACQHWTHRDRKARPMGVGSVGSGVRDRGVRASVLWVHAVSSSTLWLFSLARQVNRG